MLVCFFSLWAPIFCLIQHWARSSEQLLGAHIWFWGTWEKPRPSGDHGHSKAMQDCFGRRRLLIQKVSNSEPKGNRKLFQAPFRSLPALSIFLGRQALRIYQFRGTRWLLVHMHCFRWRHKQDIAETHNYFPVVCDLPTVGNKRDVLKCSSWPSWLSYFQAGLCT